MTKAHHFFLLLSLFSASCLAEPSRPEHTSAIASPIVKGTDSDATQDATVLVMHYDALQKGGGAASGCTGSLLAPRLVLTARHCVSITDPGAACNSQGKPVAGGAVTGDHTPNAIYVFGGKDRPDFLSGTARPSRGQEILTTGATTLCDNDIALVVLDRPLEGAKITPIRLDAKPTKGEKVTVVGWGISEDQPNPPTRRQRTDVEIIDVGPAEELGPAEFRIGEGTCQGDSGGPAIAASGAVLGALSRGGNGTGGTGADTCLGGTNIFSSVSAHADFIRGAYEKVGQEPWLEGGPNPLLAKLGAVCAVDGDCQSSTCNGEQKTCAQDCAQAACPSGLSCTDQGSRKLCVASKEPDEGCTMGRSPSSSSLCVLVACVLAVFFRSVRRKNRARSKA